MTSQAPRDLDDLPNFEEILRYLQQTRGFDFTAYKRPSLVRRVIRRMQVVGAETFEAYLEHLQLHESEFGELFNTILINVTSFFRDLDVWTHVAEEILPRLLDKRRDGVVRIWSAGCAGGHEPYTIAMLIADRIGQEAARDRIKIYATDVDQQALTEARAGVYTAREISDVPVPFAEKYFDSVGTQHSIRHEIRRMVIFGHHNLVQDAPISRIDLLICRNTLMYFHAEAQSRILGRFYYSLNPSGYVLLGRAEMLFSYAAMFTPVDLKRRLFRPVPTPHHRDRLLLLAQTGRHFMTQNTPDHTRARLREALFDSDGTAQIVLDLSGALAAVNGPARELFGLRQRDVGRRLQDLEISYRPVELRSSIDHVVREKREVALNGVAWMKNSETRHFDILVAPVVDDERALIGIRVSFRDVTEFKILQEALQHSKVELETAYEELQSTNEELETTNEELQSTVEELETTNEELQSTNEELETMNEELQATNEELQTMNEELRNRSTDLNLVNSFLESVFASLRSAVVVLDRDYRVQVWNERATDLWGLRADEVQGDQFLGLDIGLPVAELRQPVRDVLAGDGTLGELVLRATNRRGRSIDCRVSIAPLRQGDQTVRGAILLMDEAEPGDAKDRN
jgi:two-component system CheB/CheR fusion protein